MDVDVLARIAMMAQPLLINFFVGGVIGGVLCAGGTVWEEPKKAEGGQQQEIKKPAKWEVCINKIAVERRSLGGEDNKEEN